MALERGSTPTTTEQTSSSEEHRGSSPSTQANARSVRGELRGLPIDQQLAALEPGGVVQQRRRPGGDGEAASIQPAAARGSSGEGGALPFFGERNVDAVVAGRPGEPLQARFAGVGPAGGAGAVQRKGAKEPGRGADEQGAQGRPASVDDLGVRANSAQDFEIIYEAVQKLAPTEAITPPFPAAEFQASMSVFHGAADRAHELYRRYKLDDNRYFGAKWMAGAQEDMAWYEGRAVDVAVLETSTQGWFGTIAQQRASWLRLTAFAQQRGIPLEQMVGGQKGESQLDRGAMEKEAAKIAHLSEVSGSRGLLGGSSLQVKGQEYFDAWRGVTTAQRGAVASLVAARRATNQTKDDAAEQRRGEIGTIADVVSTFEKAVGVAMSNLGVLTRNIQAWQSDVTGAAVVVGESGEITISDPEVSGPDVMANLRSYAGKADVSGSAIIDFVFDGELARINAAIDTVNTHEAAFQRVIGSNEAIARVQALRDAVARFKTAAAAMKSEAETMRRAHLALGVETDEKLRAKSNPDERLSEGKEATASALALMALVRECLLHTNLATTTAGALDADAVGLRDRIGAFTPRRHATDALNDLAESIGGVQGSGEYHRYNNMRRAIGAIRARLDRRRQHLGVLNEAFEGGLGGRGSTNGEDTY